MKKLPLILACLIALGTAACNTVKGVGRDIQKGGEAIEKAAK
ncbi:MAG: entericidin A/B family lipoprotein [Rhodocyclaceae bacterium]|nr:entericidin A/B family lipoprotein [Rhodocyclaceae bacterium]